MSPYLAPIGSALMILGSLGMLWALRRRSDFRKQQDGRTYGLMALAWLIIGVAVFVPSESGSVFVTLAGTAVAVVALILLMISTWRRASIRRVN